MAKRFENLSKHEQIKTLVRIHNRLNEALFENELHKAKAADTVDFFEAHSGRVYIDIVDADNKEIANYKSFAPMGEIVTQEIDFHSTWLTTFISTRKNITQQKTFLVINMLHEMIHQYMHEKRLDNGENNGHNALFIEERKKRGLIREETKTDQTIVIDANLAQIAYSIQFYTETRNKGE